MSAKMKEESRRQSEINDELERAKTEKLANLSGSGFPDLSFPITTN